MNGCHGPYTGSVSVGGLLPRNSFDFEMHSKSSCNDSPHLGYTEFIPPYAALTATHVSANGATLELGGWTQRDWWYKRTEPSGDNTCHKQNAGDTTVALTGLQPNTQYSYWAYWSSDCAAANSLRSTAAPGITFSTVSMAASEPGATTATITLNGGHHGQPWWYAQTAMNPSWPGGQPFPGNCHTGGVAKSGGSSVVVRGLDPGNGNSSKSYTFTAYSDADCSVARAMGSVNADTLWPRLSANTISGGGARLTLGNWGANDPDWHYRVNVVVPGSPNIVLHGAEGCTAVTSGALQVDIDSLPPLVGYGAYYIFTAYSASGCHYSKVAASTLLGGSYAPPSLSASAVTQTGATLTIANHPGTWYYQADAGPDATCQGPVQAVTATLAGLSAGTTYNYTAYSDSGCTARLAAAPAFTTLASLSADNRTDTTARLTISSHSGNWYVKQTAPSPAGDCSFTHLRYDARPQQPDAEHDLYVHRVQRLRVHGGGRGRHVQHAAVDAQRRQRRPHDGDAHHRPAHGELVPEEDGAIARGELHGGRGGPLPRADQPHGGHDVHLHGLQRLHLRDGHRQAHVQHATPPAHKRQLLCKPKLARLLGARSTGNGTAPPAGRSATRSRSTRTTPGAGWERERTPRPGRRTCFRRE